MKHRSATIGALHVSSPFGTAVIRYGEEPAPIQDIHLPAPEPAEAFGPFRAPDAVRRLADMLLGYFENFAMIPIRWDWLDLTGLTELQLRTLREVGDIPPGAVKSYGAVAEAIGRPRAARFVGATMAANRFPLLVPCHRVVRSDGGLGGFGGGIELKRSLLEQEARTAGEPPPFKP